MSYCTWHNVYYDTDSCPLCKMELEEHEDVLEGVIE